MTLQRAVSLSLGLLLLSWLGLACSGPQWVHSDCRPAYDECVNQCAGTCDQGSATLGPAYGDNTIDNYNWDASCQNCTDACAAVANSCEERLED